MIDGGRPLLCENLVDNDPPVCNAPIFDLFSPAAPWEWATLKNGALEQFHSDSVTACSSAVVQRPCQKPTVVQTGLVSGIVIKASDRLLYVLIRSCHARVLCCCYVFDSYF